MAVMKGTDKVSAWVGRSAACYISPTISIERDTRITIISDSVRGGLCSCICLDWVVRYVRVGPDQHIAF
ncbi:hypothetical protein BJY04DRAFT_180331 [Aspergillus karnatakaensis]|uniref:uncharacterized protein n=1 Tax=Aspergillus karnatakaensis TaxID=1810916 RepID=UPI003CCE290F